LILTLRIIGFFLLIVSILLIILGIYAPSEVIIEQTQLIAAPQSLVWEVVTNPDKAKLWFIPLQESSLKKDTDSLLFFYPDSINKTSISIAEINEHEFIKLSLGKNYKNPVIQNLNIAIILKSLRDGSTEVNSQITYEIKNFSGRIVNKLYFERTQQDLLQKSLNSLKNHLEKI